MKYGTYIVAIPITQKPKAMKKYSHCCFCTSSVEPTIIGIIQPGSIEPSVEASDERV